MNLHIGSIIPTQRVIRNRDQIRPMVDFVRSGRYFDQVELDRYAAANPNCYGMACAPSKPSPLIQIDQMEDGVMYARDGHHRLFSIWSGSRAYLLPSEYQVKQRTYAQYAEINLRAGWTTPFDPRVEIRKANLANWKEHVSMLIQCLYNLSLDEFDVQEMIRDAHDDLMYTEPRGNLRHIKDVER